MTDATAIEPGERIIWRADLYRLLGVGSECVRRYMRNGKLPKPDIDLSVRRQGWKVSTLQAAGIGIPT